MRKILVKVLLLICWQQSSAEMEHQFIDVLGTQLHYSQAGDGPALILLHGLWGGTNEWEPVVEALSEQHRVIALDLPGFHQSEKLDVRYSNAVLAEYLEQFIVRMELDDVIVMGHAMGANLATYTAVHRGDDIAALILVDGAGYRNPDRDLSQPPSEGMTRFIKMATGDTLESTRGLLERRVFDTSLVDEAWVESALAMWRNSAKAITDMLREGGDLTTAEMQQIGVPTLVVWGAEDKVFPPSNVDRLRADISTAESHLIEESGHLPQIEQTNEFLSVVLPFLENHATR